MPYVQPVSEILAQGALQRRLGVGGDTELLRTQLTEGMGEIPAYPDLPQYQPPGYDRARVRGLTQQVAGPQVSNLRGGLLRSLQYARSSENPNVRGLLTRQALQGYGAGLGDIMGRAGGLARSQYEAERAPDIWGAQAGYQAQLSKQRMEYQAQIGERSLLNQQLLSQTGRLPTQRFGARPPLPRPTTGRTALSGMQAPTPAYGQYAGVSSYETLLGMGLADTGPMDMGMGAGAGDFDTALERVGQPTGASYSRMRVEGGPWQDISQWGG